MKTNLEQSSSGVETVVDPQIEELERVVAPGVATSPGPIGNHN